MYVCRWFVRVRTENYIPGSGNNVILMFLNEFISLSLDAFKPAKRTRPTEIVWIWKAKGKEQSNPATKNIKIVAMVQLFQSDYRAPYITVWFSK